jgi:hypothetical protein
VEQVDGDTIITLGEPEPFGGTYSGLFGQFAGYWDFS